MSGLISIVEHTAGGPASALQLQLVQQWLDALRDGLDHQAHWLQLDAGGGRVAYLPLMLVSSRLFGRFLVSLPYLNTGGVVAENEAAAATLIDRAVALADELDVRYLELRHERAVEHPALTQQMTSKVHMRLALPATVDELRRQMKSKVRSQVKKAGEFSLAVRWGREELLPDFYDVFSRNMRDLGTPVYGRRLFRAILEHLPDQAELCCVFMQHRPVAAALVVHARGKTDVPSASSLRRFNFTNANMLMYWHLLARAVERGQRLFDFGRSTVDSSTYRFKRQWGAAPFPAVWQYYVRRGSISQMRPESPRYQLMIRAWRHLPLWLTRLIGPLIVRGIP